jgi:4-amino-4-deoxy-L-arabinose transferase-like glycosyltransferase
VAENLVQYGTFGAGDKPTAFRPPLYPLLLGGCLTMGDYSRAAIGVLHLLFGLGTVGLVLLLGRWLGLGSRGAALAGLLVACDPILLSQSTQVMTETPAAFLATAGLAAVVWASRRPTAFRTLLAAATLGLGALCRPTLLPFAILAGVILVVLGKQDASATEVASHSGRIAERLRLAAAFALGLLVVLSPWAIRNEFQFGRPIVTTTHGGYTLLLANNPEFYEWLHAGQWGDVWWADRFNAEWDQRKPRDELQADRLAYAESLETIRREPGTFAYACLVRLGRFWSPLPHQIIADESPLRRFSRYGVAVWYVAEFLLVFVWIYRSMRSSPFSLRSSPFILCAVLLVACLTAAHTIFWTDMRMRAPLMPVVALAAAAGWSLIEPKKTVPSPRREETV